MKILENEDDRVLLGESFEEAPPGRERFCAPFRGSGLTAQADERP